ncbi:hypothetical protein ACFTS5_08020 [Nocardia sp. NPDC056952]|uniref:hypothetical protein n=1 Tax=Nocardia sp. NPDC056952 TaxID=3345979 RepID=UPI00362C0C2F
MGLDDSVVSARLQHVRTRTAKNVVDTAMTGRFATVMQPDRGQVSGTRALQWWAMAINGEEKKRLFVG